MTTIQVSSVSRRRIATFAPPLLVALLALPFVLHQNAWWEWSTALWLLERQAAYVAAHGAPTFFLHSGAGAFNAFYVFYGGFTFSVLAYPAAALGAWPVFAAATAGAMAAGYSGIWWTARNLGLSHQLAILPAAAFATTPYLLTDLYGRGAWAELVAVNAAAVMLGGLTALVWRPDRRYGRAFAALAASGAVVAGTHNVTLLVSTLLLPLLLLAVLPLAPRSAGLRGTVKRLTRGLVAVVLGVGLAGAWLVPNLWLGPDTYISDPAISQGVLQEKVELLRISNVLSPWPVKPAADPGRWIYAQGPVLAMAWTLMALSTIVWARRRRPDRVTAAAGALVAVSSGVLLLIVDPHWWPTFPRLVQAVQSPMRLIPYLAIGVALGITVALTALGGLRARRLMTGALTVAVGAQVAMALFIVVGTKAAAKLPVPLPRHGDVRAGTEPPTFSGPRVFTQVQFRIVRRPAGAQPTAAPLGVFVEDPTTSDHAELQGTGAVGDRHSTAVVWSPLVRIDGDARVAGRDANGMVVLTVTRTEAAGRWHATARSRCTLCLTGGAPWQLAAGRLLTLLSAVALSAVGLAGLYRRLTGGDPRPEAIPLAPADAGVEDQAQRPHVSAT